MQISSHPFLGLLSVFYLVLTFVRCKEIDCYRAISAGKLAATAIHTNHFFPVFFSIFELGGITKHLITGPSGNSEFRSPRPQCSPRQR